jgi:hypothetical protein
MYDYRQALPVLRQALVAQRLDPERLDPWLAWKTFKQFLRSAEWNDSEFVFVGLGIEHQDDQYWHLTLVREFEHLGRTIPQPSLLRKEHLQRKPREPTALWDVVCDLRYPLAGPFAKGRSEYSSGHYPTIEAFVGAVEADSLFQAAMAAAPVGSTLYEEEVW